MMLRETSSFFFSSLCIRLISSDYSDTIVGFGVLTAVVNSSVLLEIAQCSPVKTIDVSEQQVACNFRFEEQSKQEISINQVVDRVMLRITGFVEIVRRQVF
jgi:hypothetical protein